MAATASKPRSARAAAGKAGSGTKRKRTSASGTARGGSKRAAARDGSKRAVTRGGSKRAAAAVSPKRAAAAAGKKVIGKATKTAARKTLSVARQAIETGLSKAADSRPPIQAAVDVAAPLSVVWDEWMSFEAFTEGLHRIEGVEREGNELVGHTAGPDAREWRAEIVDEREHESFAWRSVEGTDCAGLITFHRLSDRLTRVDADLDVMPTNPVEVVLLSLRIPNRRAQRELQRFKARVDFINPDVYEDEDSGQSEPDTHQDGGQTGAAEEQGGN